MPRTSLAPLLLLGLSITGAPDPSTAVTTAWSEHEPVRVRLVAPWRVAPRSGQLWLGFEVDLADGWHIYWKNSGDAGFPPVLEASSDPPMATFDLLFPAPQRYPVPGGLVAIGYEGRMIYPIRVALDAGDHDRLVVDLVADYLVCQEDCVPFHDQLTLELPLGEPVSDPEISDRLRSWRQRLPRALEDVPEVDIEASRGGSELRIHVQAPDANADALDLFFEPVNGFSLGEPIARREAAGVTFEIPLAATDVRTGIPDLLSLGLVVTGLGSDSEPLAIETRLSVAAVETSSVQPEVDEARLVAEGALLGLTPSVLALLGLLCLWPQRQLRLTLGPLSEIWPFVAGSFTGFLILGLGLHLWSRALETPFFASPASVAGTALGPLGLALWLWCGRPLGIERPRSLGRDLLASVLAAPLLALPWFPAAGSLAPVAVGRAEIWEIGLAAAGFSGPFLLAGAWITLGSTDPRSRHAAAWSRGLGFLTAISLIWVSFLLLDRAPTHRLAFLQLDWLLVALAAHTSTVVDRGRSVWRAVALALAAASPLLVLG